MPSAVFSGQNEDSGSHFRLPAVFTESFPKISVHERRKVIENIATHISGFYLNFFVTKSYNFFFLFGFCFAPSCMKGVFPVMILMASLLSIYQILFDRYQGFTSKCDNLRNCVFYCTSKD